MARIPRGELVPKSLVALYHCAARCLPGKRLGGSDKAGKSFDHRRRWIVAQLEVQSQLLCVDVLGFSIEPMQIQLLLRTRPDRARDLSDAEVARRYVSALHAKVGFEEQRTLPAEDELADFVTNRVQMKRARGRLSDLTWFVSQLTEPTARNCNREDATTGRFWEGRYSCLPVLDPQATAACLAHVELSPIAIADAASLAGCKYSSIKLRTGPRKNSSPAWIAPIVVTEPNSKADKSKLRAPAVEGAVEGLLLPIRETDYLTIVEWTARQVKRETLGQFPDALAELFVQLGVAPAAWLTLVREFPTLFHRAAGNAESLEKLRKRRGLRQLHGIATARELFS